MYTSVHKWKKFPLRRIVNRFGLPSSVRWTSAEARRMGQKMSRPTYSQEILRRRESSRETRVKRDEPLHLTLKQIIRATSETLSRRPNEAEMKTAALLRGRREEWSQSLSVSGQQHSAHKQ